MSINPQLQCSFATHLPRKVREAIYLELWRSSGLRQHIMWHPDYSDTIRSHFCRWPCTTTYQVEDELQEKIEILRQQKNVPFGDDLTSTLLGRRLQSPWLSHWQCGEHAEEAHKDATGNHITSGGHCWKKSPLHDHDRSSKSAYIPMLLSCKLMLVYEYQFRPEEANLSSSSECVASIYGSTTFIFTDMMALQMFLGYCEIPPAMKDMPNISLLRQSFFRHTRYLELSLTPEFSVSIPCTMNLPGIDTEKTLHHVFDFHWLRLKQFVNLQSIKIWIAARSISPILSHYPSFVTTDQLGFNSLQRALQCFDNIDGVTISTPLNHEISPEDGFVQNLPNSNIRLWKRGTGDRFHPYLWYPNPGDFLDGVIHTNLKRYVYPQILKCPQYLTVFVC
jgi:hypothetical protein